MARGAFGKVPGDAEEYLVWEAGKRHSVLGGGMDERVVERRCCR